MAAVHAPCILLCTHLGCRAGQGEAALTALPTAAVRQAMLFCQAMQDGALPGCEPCRQCYLHQASCWFEVAVMHAKCLLRCLMAPGLLYHAHEQQMQQAPLASQRQLCPHVWLSDLGGSLQLLQPARWEACYIAPCMGDDLR
jgi:hypothetical protein